MLLLFLGNTKVITQTALQTFQDEMGKAMSNPYKVCTYLKWKQKLQLSFHNQA